jgi:hypothetical protein
MLRHSPFSVLFYPITVGVILVSHLIYASYKTRLSDACIDGQAVPRERDKAPCSTILGFVFVLPSFSLCNFLNPAITSCLQKSCIFEIDGAYFFEALFPTYLNARRYILDAVNLTFKTCSSCTNKRESHPFTPSSLYIRYYECGPGSSVGIVTGYGLDGPGIESRWGRDFLHLSTPSMGPTQPPV